MRSEEFRIVEDICFSKSNHLFHSTPRDIEPVPLAAYQDLGRLA